MSNTRNDVDVTLQDSSASDRLKAIDSMKLFELKEELKKRKLKTSGDKKVLQDRLRARLAFEIEHGEDGSESECDEDEDEDEDEHDQKDVKRCSCHMRILKFEDVEESLSTFSGEYKEDVCYWLQEFEDIADFCKWSVAQKVVYARRLLRGAAKIFVGYEGCCRNWSEMKRALRSEFSQVVDAHKIHKELPRRIKKSNETYQENSKTKSRRTEEKKKGTIRRGYRHIASDCNGDETIQFDRDGNCKLMV